MKKIIIGLVALSSLGIVSCKKKDVVLDNSYTIKEPYALYCGGKDGSLYKTNDGADYDVKFYGNGAFTNAVWVIDTNIVQLRTRLFCNSGMTTLMAPLMDPAFIPMYNASMPHEPGLPNISCYDASNRKFYVINNLAILHENNQSATVGNYTPSAFDPSIGNPGAIIAVTNTDNGDVFCLNVSGQLYRRISTNPFASVNSLDTTNGKVWTLNHINNRLIATELAGKAQPKYSDDFGGTWLDCSGYPLGYAPLFTHAPNYNNSFFIGTDSGSVYKLDGSNFVKSAGNIPQYARVFDMAGKRNVYRTDEAKYYYYLATDKGLYKSENDGADWVKVNDMVFSALR